MPLSDDQRALLRLLAQREQGYEDIAALKGKSVAEVREEVSEALAALDAPPPEPPAPAPRDSEPAPAAEPPAAPRSERTAAPPSLQSRRAAGPIPPVERRRLVFFAGGALGIVAVVLAAIALFGGDSDSGDDSAGTASAEAAALSDKVTQAVLTSPDGGEASGNAVFGRLGKEEIVLQVTGEGLEPTEEGETYTVWLYRTPKLTLRVGSVAVGDEGRLAARFPIPAELLAYVAGGAFNQVYVSRASTAAYQQEVARAKRNKTLPRYTGETVLTGEITGPIVKK